VVRATVGDAHRVEVGPACLVAAGRTPNVEGLGLDAAGWCARPPASLSTSVAAQRAHRVRGRRRHATASSPTPRFEAVQAVRACSSAAAAERTIPWCTFTDPELARIGLSRAEAEDIHGTDTDVWQKELARSDRCAPTARTEGPSSW
jgi:pyruvate/2-oxoglutarate dehydrogenase complex dihydrolipoamide dehydrogenase (E3) component